MSINSRRGTRVEEFCQSVPLTHTRGIHVSIHISVAIIDRGQRLLVNVHFHPVILTQTEILLSVMFFVRLSADPKLVMIHRFVSFKAVTLMTCISEQIED